MELDIKYFEPEEGGGEGEDEDVETQRRAVLPRKQATALLKPMNEGQAEAVSRMLQHVEWWHDQYDKTFCDPFIALKGPGGVGKTFCAQHFVAGHKGKVLFTAPTNKATKVLRQSLRSDWYVPECRTIYSALGLKIGTNGELKELVDNEEPIDLSKYSTIFVDEGSMIPANVMQKIREASEYQNLPFIFMYDHAQLPPVKEKRSQVCDIRQQLELTQNMRQDGPLLRFSTALRNVVDMPFPKFNFSTDVVDGHGVRRMSKGEMSKSILEAAEAQTFLLPEHTKCIAWRNITVDQMNLMVRRQMFLNDAVKQKFLVSERVILTEPAKDFINEEGKTIAHTDDEGTIEHVEVARHPIHSEFDCWRLTIRLDDNKGCTLWALHDTCSVAFQKRLAELSEAARASPRLWSDFWTFKECFHAVRHAYAITAHRAQGSTYTQAFVDFQDILLNRERNEAYRAFYVAGSRPKLDLYLA